MRKFLRVWAFVGIQFIVSAPAIADAPDTLWTRTYGGTEWDYGNSVQECAGGGFIIAGRWWLYNRRRDKFFWCWWFGCLSYKDGYRRGYSVDKNLWRSRL